MQSDGHQVRSVSGQSCYQPYPVAISDHFRVLGWSKLIRLAACYPLANGCLALLVRELLGDQAVSIRLAQSSLLRLASVSREDQ